MFKKRMTAGVLCGVLIVILCACGALKETNEQEGKVSSCAVSVSCEEILRHMANLPEEKHDLVPADGILFADEAISFSEDETALQILERALKKEKIHFDRDSTYIKGIGNLYEKDCGDYSGWIYTVNGDYVEVGADAYHPKDGDIIEWSYMTGLE